MPECAISEVACGAPFMNVTMHMIPIERCLYLNNVTRRVAVWREVSSL